MIPSLNTYTHLQIVQSPSQLKEQLFLWEDFTDSLRGYSAVKSVKKLVKHLEKMQSQYNIAADQVSLTIVYRDLLLQ